MARHDGGAAGVASPTIGEQGGIAVAHTDLLERDLENFGRDLGEARFVTLALRAATAQYRHRTLSIDLHAGALEEAECRGLGEHGDAASAPK